VAEAYGCGWTGAGHNMISDLLYRIRSLFRRDVVETEMNEELRFHFEQQVQKYVSSGLAADEARRQARLTIGGEDKVREDCREARGVGFIETLFSDLRYGARSLRKDPIFALVMAIPGK
jgi:hypothetical protein